MLRLFRRSTRTSIAICILGLGILTAQIQSNAPIKDFRLPIFSDEGRLLWDVSGMDGVYVSAEQIDVRGATFHAYGNHAHSEATLRIECQRASVFHETGQARGEGSVFAKGESFVVTGENWSWDTPTQTLMIEEDVRVLFNLSLNSLLK